MDLQEIKERIIGKARSLGVNLIRTCTVQKWEEIPLQPREFWPQSIWPWVKSVIVLGIPLFSPMVATTPSMVYQELYDTSNRVLDDCAYRLTNYIVAELGLRAVYFPRDCYYGIRELLARPAAAFSHVLAGYYAGMGTIGDSHNLLTPEFGPRLRIVSVLTDAPVSPDAMLQKNLCLHCRKCLKNCPSHAFSEDGGAIYRMDKSACTKYHILLQEQKHWPCGVCLNVCPVGEDRKAYAEGKQVTEEGVRHCGIYGS